MIYGFSKLICGTFPVIFFICAFGIPTKSQQKKRITQNDYLRWRLTQSEKISRNGQWVSWEESAQHGDGTLFLSRINGSSLDSFPRGYQGIISPGADFFVCRIKPPFDTIFKLKLAKKKKDEMPGDSLMIFRISDKKRWYSSEIQSYKVPDKKASFCAFTYKPKVKTTKSDSSVTGNKKKSTQQSKDKKTKSLVILQPLTGQSDTFPDCSQYAVDRMGRYCAFIRAFGDSIDSCSVELFRPGDRWHHNLYSGTGRAEKIALDQDGKQLTWLMSTDTSAISKLELWYWSEKEDKAKTLIPGENSWFNTHFSFSKNAELRFSYNGKRIITGIGKAPERPKKDSLPEDEKYHIDIWSWHDTLLQPQQKKELDEEKKRTRMTVVDIASKKICVPGNHLIRNLTIPDHDNAPLALAVDDYSNASEMSWNWPYDKIVYTVNLKICKRTKLLEHQRYTANLSPSGKWLLYWSDKEKKWHVMDTRDPQKDIVLYKDGMPAFYDRYYDMPNDIPPIGAAGWSENDDRVLIYDEFDIWAFDPAGKKEPVNITNGVGRKEHIRFRYVKLDPDAIYISADSDLLLQAHNMVDHSEGFYTVNIKNGSAPHRLVMSDHAYRRGIQKATDANRLIWQRESFEASNQVFTSTFNFDHVTRISHSNPFQKNYLHGRVRLIHFPVKDTTEEALLYLPPDFDSTKKYPMIVYFYELYSTRKNWYSTPHPSYSTIGFNEYTSNGYIVLVPNIRYEKGHPGRSAVTYIEAAATYVSDLGFVNKKAIGIQGQSWGGYEVAFVITQSTVFRCAMAGAPVSNMTSAYGGIRWGSGLSRMFQYEDTQSRIGATLWQNPERYIENSPLFHADAVQTPLLIMHNDHDGAVPWYQGIEYFSALRRLHKPVWMLSYNDEEHNLKKWPDRVDLSIRMMQFFNYYLKSEEMPPWMSNGVPALKKGKGDAYYDK